MNFALAGTGNAAWHMATMLCGAGHQLVRVWSHSGNAPQFAKEFDGTPCRELSALHEGSEILIVAVSDDAIANTAEQINADATTVHLSGTVPLVALPQHKRAVAWPVQSLTRGVAVNYSQMPVLIESGHKETAARLTELLESVPVKIYRCTGEQRARGHLAAVFAGNLVNRLYSAAFEVATGAGLKPEVLYPLIDETAKKMQQMSADEALTGPARRGDLETLERHMALLSDRPELQDIYRTITNSILKRHGKQL